MTGMFYLVASACSISGVQIVFAKELRMAWKALLVSITMLL